jgi:hypothetical protein
VVHPVLVPISVDLIGNGFDSAISKGPIKLTPLCPSDHFCLSGEFELRNGRIA